VQTGEHDVSKKYREFADECMGWAKTAGTDKEREIFIEMAGTWLRAVALAERTNLSFANATSQMAPASHAELP
jgi:hypothetical protein